MAVEVYFGDKKVDGEHRLTYDDITKQLRLVLPQDGQLYTVLMTSCDITPAEVLKIDGLVVNVMALADDQVTRQLSGQVLKLFRPSEVIAWSQRYHGIHSIYVLRQSQVLRDLTSPDLLKASWLFNQRLSAIAALCQRRGLTEVAVVNYWLDDKAVCW